MGGVRGGAGQGGRDGLHQRRSSLRSSRQRLCAQVAEHGAAGTTGGGGGISGRSVYGRESVGDTCQEGYDHAEGYPAGEED